jgi:hypothetical protein
MNLQIVLFDDQPGPHDVHQLLLRDDPIAAFDKSFEQIEGPSTELRQMPVGEQNPPVLINADLAFTEGHFVWRHVYRTAVNLVS